MPLPRLYTSKNLTKGRKISLDQSASQHLLRVLRARAGDFVMVFNGEGGEYRGKLIEVNQNKAIIELLQYEDNNRESPLAIHLLQGISRGERMDYVIQKASELGVASITPLFTERGTVKLSGERLTKRLNHWRLTAISACEQSGRCYLPDIKPAISLADYMAGHEANDMAFVCDLGSKRFIRDYPRLTTSVNLLIGPEGGLTDQEVQLAGNVGFQPLSLGPRILRTETAPVVAITLLQGHGGDF